MKNLFVSGSVLFMALLFGCSTSPVVNKFMDPEIPAKEHALLSIDNNIGVGMIDGELTFGASGAGTDGTMRSRTPMILLTPGRHTLLVQYIHQTSDPNSTTTTTSDLIPVTGNFMAGHYYKLQPEMQGNVVAFAISEETDTNIWSTKDLTSVKPPKKVLVASVIRRAAESEPTQLEGAWAVKDVPGSEFSFVGQSYLSKKIITLNEAQLKGQNDLRRMSGQSVLSSPAFSAQRGTFVLNENTIIVGQLQMALDNNIDTALWGDTSRKLETTYEFTFNPEGYLALTFKKGRQMLNPFSQEDALILIKKE
jgi:hypothetical protein